MSIAPHTSKPAIAMLDPLFHIFVPMHQYAMVEALIYLRSLQTSILNIYKEFLQGLVWP